MKVMKTDTTISKRLMLLLPSLCLAVLLAGCYAPGAADPDRVPDSRYPRIVTLGWLDNDFFFAPPKVVEEHDGKPMMVSVDVRRKEPAWNRELPCQYRFIFLDKNGIALDPNPTWQFRMMEPKTKVILQASAPDTGAVDWRCEIRKNRSAKKRRLWRWY